MKKRVAKVLCLVLGVAFLTSCNAKEEFIPKNYTGDKEHIAEIRIDVSDRLIEVTPSADNQIHIDYFENSKEYYDISISDDQVLTMSAASNKEWTDYIGFKSDINSRKISLQLPNTLFNTLKLSTTNEDIVLPTITSAYDISLSSQDGNIIFNELSAENSISLNAKNGDISGSIMGNYNDYSITCNIKKGKSNLPESKEMGTKNLEVSNNNGDINIEFLNS